ncbi:MAG TPA: hypothetical protein VN018_03520 [Brevundimonas sp.]|nr:hypothetical protein [Brevundimonas sp.]
MKLVVLLAAVGAALTLGVVPVGSATPLAESCHADCFTRCQALYPNDVELISSCTNGCVLFECNGDPWPLAPGQAAMSITKR